jgi:hypothetical protein
VPHEGQGLKLGTGIFQQAPLILFLDLERRFLGTGISTKTFQQGSLKSKQSSDSKDVWQVGAVAKWPKLTIFAWLISLC